MKRILFLLTFILGMSLAVHSQSYKIKEQLNYAIIDQNALLNDSSDTYSFTFDATALSKKMYYTLMIGFNGTVDNAATTSPLLNIYRSYGYEANSAFTNIDTIQFGGTQDTLVVFTDLSTGSAYPYYKLYVEGVDSITTRVDFVGIKFVQ